MDEEEQTTEGEKPATENTGDGVQQETINPLDRADAQIKRMSELDQSLGEKVEKLSQLEARRTLSGRSEAGQPPVNPAKDTPEAYAEKFRKGEVNPLLDDGVRVE